MPARVAGDRRAQQVDPALRHACADQPESGPKPEFIVVWCDLVGGDVTTGGGAEVPAGDQVIAVIR